MRTLTVPDDLVESLERQAAAHGRSLEEEHRAILAGALPTEPIPLDKADWIERLRKLREETRGRTFTPSEVLVREMRDER